ncbi:TerC family protein [Taibaiella lutea]|uniref:TerC family protein n=1 Tax=Taibaiella lutea TaxID=2608001 RepID=A0A5M6CNJ1_9BACT|nr:TerC family protein [Taibaiella lutea]KAA5536613.1 TerC family protein [Taibaiella lutea]
MELLTADNLISLIVLVVLEIVLGIDNVIFVSIILNRLPEELRKRGRLIWMFTGITVRAVLLFGLQWLLQQKGKPVITIWDKGFDLASLVMIGGGIFLIYKTVMEIHHKLEGEEEHVKTKKSQLTLGRAVVQIILIDMVFSFDSIITAGGTAKILAVMIIAVVIAMIVMFLFSGRIATFIQKHPTIKMLALSFLVMIGFILLVEGFNSEKAEELHLKNYAYFAMAFSFMVELLNMKLRKKSEPVMLKDSDTAKIKEG